MTLESNKTIGLIGAILILIGAIGIFGIFYLAILALVGAILIVVALHGLADYYGEKGILNGALYGLIAEIIAVVAAVVTLFYLIFDTTIFTSLLDKVYPGWNGDWSSLQSMTPVTTGLNFSDVASVLGAILAVFVVFWVLTIIATILDRQSLKTLAVKSNIGLFSTAAIVLVIGAVLTIVIIGFVIMWIAVLLLAIAFYQLKPKVEQPPVTYPVPPPSTPTPV